MKLQPVVGDETELDTRDRLVRAAIEVFLEKGYGGTRVQDIAKRAGYTAGALYVHFPSRTALLGEAIMLEGSRLIAEIVDGFGQITPGDGAVSRTLAEFSVAETGPIDTLVLEALALAARDPEAREMLAETLTHLEEALVAQIQLGVKLGVVDPALDIDAIRTFFSAWILGLVVHRAVGLRRADLDPMYELCARLTEGLTPRSAEQG